MGKKSHAPTLCHILPCLLLAVLATTWSPSYSRVHLHKGNLFVSSLPSQLCLFFSRGLSHSGQLAAVATVWPSYFVTASVIIFLSLKSHEFCLKLSFILALSPPFLLQCLFSASKQRTVIVTAVDAF